MCAAAICVVMTRAERSSVSSGVESSSGSITPCTCNCWNNAPVERFFSSLKREWTGDQLYRTRQEAIADAREYVAVYYNSKRLHSTLGYKTPMDYEKNFSKVSGIT